MRVQNKPTRWSVLVLIVVMVLVAAGCSDEEVLRAVIDSAAAGAIDFCTSLIETAAENLGPSV